MSTLKIPFVAFVGRDCGRRDAISYDIEGARVSVGVLSAIVDKTTSSQGIDRE